MKFYNFFLLLVVLFAVACKPSNPDVNENEASLKKEILVARTLADKNMQKGFSYLDSAYSLIKNPTITNKWICLEFKYNTVYNKIISANKVLSSINRKDLEECELYADSMLALFKNVPVGQYTHERYVSNFAKGDILIEKNNYKDAYPYYYKAKQLVNATTEKCLLYGYNRRLGALRFRNGDFKQSAKYFKDAYMDNLSCGESENKYYGILSSLIGIGKSYQGLQMPDSSIVYYKMALNHIDKHLPIYKDNSSIVTQYSLTNKMYIYSNMADDYILVGKLDSARKSINNALQIGADKKIEQSNFQKAKLKLGNILLSEGKVDQTKALLAELKADINAFPNANSEMLLNKLQYDYLLQIGNQPKASIYFKKYQQNKEALDKYNFSSKTIDASEELFKLQNDYEVSTLTHQNKLGRTYLIFAIIITLMSILLIILLVRSFKYVKANNKVLNENNRQMVQQNDYLHQALADLEETQEENKRVSQIIAHDLRSPMAAIYGLSGFMLEGGQSLEETRELTQLIRTSSLDSLKFIGDLLNKENINNVLQKEPIDLGQLVTYCVVQLRYKAKEKNQEIRMRVADITLPLSREKIWRVINNLINNAIKFSYNSAKINVELMQQNNMAVLKIKDYGIGIPENLKDKVFEGSAESKRLGTNGEQSFGLGLTICKQIINAHGGRLYFESIPGKCTTFFIELDFPS